MENEKPVNPYQAPSAATLTATPENNADSFIPDGRAVNAGNGWNWISAAWKLFAASPWIWIVNILIFFVITFALGMAPFGSLVNIILGPLWIAGFLYGAHAIYGGRALEVGDLFAGFKEKTGPLLILGLLTLAAWFALAIATAVLFFVVLGSSGFFSAMMSNNQEAWRVLMSGAGLGLVLVFLIVFALIIPLLMATYFAPALVLFHDISPTAAIGMSFKACLRNILPFLLYGIVMFVLLILAAIPVLLGFFIVVPLMYASMYTSYRDIFLKTAA